MGALLGGCLTSEDESPIEGCLLFEVAPGSQPSQYEVLITGLLISENTEVFFDEEEADTRFVPGSGLIARVPDGLTGTVELLVQEGDCLNRKAFTVWERFPHGVPASPPSILQPAPPLVLPSDLDSTWSNAADPQHTIMLKDVDGDGQIDLRPDEPLTASFESHSEDTFLGSEQPNAVGGSYDLGSNTIELTFYRAPNGGEDESYDGQFVDPVPYDRDAVAAILLVSRLSGRQLLLLAY